MKFKAFPIPEGLAIHLQTVLERYDSSFRIEKDTAYLPDDVSDEEFEILIEDAMCEEQRLRINPAIPVVSYRTLLCEEKLNWILELQGGTEGGPFHILKKDEKVLFEV